MRGGTNDLAKVQGSCLKTRTFTQGARKTNSNPRPLPVYQDTKVSIISQEQLDSIRAQMNMNQPNKISCNKQVMSQNEWGPPLGTPACKPTSKILVHEDLTDMKRSHDKNVEQLPLEEGALALYVADSIGHNCDMEDIKMDTGMNIVTAKAYCSDFDSSARFPDKHFAAVVPEELAKKQYNLLILQSSSVDITNLKNIESNDPFLRQQVSTSSFNMIKIAERAIQNFPNVREVLILERAPRYDKMKELNKFSNAELHRFLNESQLKEQIKIGLHILDFDEEMRPFVYGTKVLNTNYDGIHLRGPEGRTAFTRSFLHILYMAKVVKKNNSNYQMWGQVKEEPNMKNKSCTEEKDQHSWQNPGSRPLTMSNQKPKGQVEINLKGTSRLNKCAPKYSYQRKNHIKLLQLNKGKENQLLLQNRFEVLGLIPDHGNETIDCSSLLKTSKCQPKRKHNFKKPRYFKRKEPKTNNDDIMVKGPSPDAKNTDKCFSKPVRNTDKGFSKPVRNTYKGFSKPVINDNLQLNVDINCAQYGTDRKIRCCQCFISHFPNPKFCKGYHFIGKGCGITPKFCSKCSSVHFPQMYPKISRGESTNEFPMFCKAIKADASKVVDNKQRINTQKNVATNWEEIEVYEETEVCEWCLKEWTHECFQDRLYKSKPAHIHQAIRMSGGANEDVHIHDIVIKAILSAHRHGIQMAPGTPNPGQGNCAFEAVIFNINDRKEFKDNQKVYIHPKEARPLWIVELQTAIEANDPNFYVDNIPGVNTEDLWDQLKRDGIYEVEFVGDLLLHAIARGSKKTILVFNTSPDAHDPIYVIDPGDLILTID